MSDKRVRRSSQPPSPRSPATKATFFIRSSQDHPWLTAGMFAGILLVAVYSVSLSSPTLIAHEQSILRQPVLSHVRNVPHIMSRDFLILTSGQFRPLSYALLALVRTFVNPDNLLFWHIWLLAFHAANTLLVFAITRHFSPRLGVALTAAGVFALHPLGTEIVNNINHFHILMGLTLSLASFKAYLSFSRSGSKTLYSLAVGLFALAAVAARPALFLGLVLIVYELLHQRARLKPAIARLLPFAIIPLIIFRVWSSYTPHPLHYKYVTAYKGLFWHGLFSVTGATGRYAGGLVLTRGIPLVLQDVVEKIYRWDTPGFLFWGAFNIVFIVGAVVALTRKHWPALGILLIYTAMIPYASVAYNRVVDYVSWSYLYFPLAGLGLAAGGVLELLLRFRHRYLKQASAVAVAAAILFLGGRSVQLNLYARSPLSYWKHVSGMNETSETALLEMAKAYLAEGKLAIALHYFFAPMVKELRYPCLAMARYYFQQGNPLASAIHLRAGSVETKMGLILEDHCQIAGELLLDAGALDHAEENFGKVLMVNPFHTGAMTRLAQVWFLKGFVGEAHRMLQRAGELAPDDEHVRQTEELFVQKEREWRDNPQPFTIAPPDPDWLRYVLTQMRSESLRRQIVALSDMVDPNDAVIQMEAIISLIIDGKYEAAAKDILPWAGRTRAEMLLYSLSGNAYACSVASRALALAGKVERAVEVGLRAVSTDSTSGLAWESLALALSLQDKPDATSQKLMGAVARHPASASMLYQELGLRKMQGGDNREAADLFEKALEKQPDNLEALRGLGEALLNLSQPEQAIAPLRKALDIDPGDAKTHASLGWAFLDKGRNAEAAEALSTAVRLDPKSSQYHSDLGVVLAKLERQEEAVQEYRRAIELEPGFVNAHYNLANLLVRAGKTSEAATEYREVIKIRPAHPHAHFTLGRVLYQQKKIDEAIAEFNEGIRHNPRLAEAYTALVTLYCEKRQYDKAWEVVKRAADLGFEIAPDAMTTLRGASPQSKE